MKWLTLTERLELMRRAVKLAGNTRLWLRAILRLEAAGRAEASDGYGACGRRSCPLGRHGVDQGNLADHFAGLADIAECPVILYEWPLVEPYAIEPWVYSRLTDTGGVIGIKDTTCTMEGIMGKIEAAQGTIVYQANTRSCWKPFVKELRVSWPSFRRSRLCFRLLEGGFADRPMRRSFTGSLYISTRAPIRLPLLGENAGRSSRRAHGIDSEIRRRYHTRG